MNELIEYMNTRQFAGDYGRFVARVGHMDGYVVGIRLLTWLQIQKRYRNERDLDLDFDYPWCRNVVTMLEMVPSLSRLFEFDENRLRFKPTIDPTERQAVRDAADEDYQPTVMT